MSTKILSLICASAAITVFAACAWGQTSIGATITRDYNFPPVGLASTETAQVNVVNIATATSTATSTTAAAPACAGTITFTNASGKTIGTATSFTTTGSQILSTTLTFSQLAVTGTRGEFLASVQLTNSSIVAHTPCSLEVSLETFDTTTGATHVYLGNPGLISSGLLTAPIGLR
jgi:hypothetical protein